MGAERVQRFDGIIRNCRVPGHATPVDVGILEGRVAALAPALRVPAKEVWEAGGRLVLPSFCDVHVHLDKCYTRGRLVNKSGTLMEAIEKWVAYAPTISREDYVQRAIRALRTAADHGVTAMRTHVDVGRGVGLQALLAILPLKEEVRDFIDLQVVALGRPGVGREESRWLRDAMVAGADLVGGVPALAADPVAAIDEVFALAEEFGRGIDLHVDETDDPGTLTLEYLADRTRATGMAGHVTAGHCCSLASAPLPIAERIMDKVAAAGIRVVSLPSCNLVLQGRGDTGPWRRGLTRVKELRARGVTVAFASDNVQDVFNPFGFFDPLHIANLGAHGAHMTAVHELEEALRMVTEDAGRVFGREGHRVAVGAQADLVLLDCDDPITALAETPRRLAVWKAGRYRSLLSPQDASAAPPLSQAGGGPR